MWDSDPRAGRTRLTVFKTVPFSRTWVILHDKNKTINILKDCYEKDLYNSYDLIDISKNTDKEIEVNDFIKEETLEKEYDYFD